MISTKLKYVLVFPIAAFGLLLCLDGSLGFLICGLALLSTCTLLIGFDLIKKMPSLVLVLSSFSFALCITEGVFYFNTGNNFDGFNKTCARYDPISGYKWTESKIRIVRLDNGELIYDNVFSTNNYGYPTIKDFSEQKKDTSVTRLLLFGNSFSAGVFNPTSMPDRLQELLDEFTQGKVEIYSFSIDGGGLRNWHNIFFKEVVDQFEFDGIILAVFGYNLLRGFTILHSNDTLALFGRFIDIPKSERDFNENYLVNMDPFWTIKSDEMMDSLMSSRPEFKLYFTRSIWKGLTTFHSEPAPTHSFNTEGLDDIDAVEKSIGKMNLSILGEMVEFCKANNKSVYLATIPIMEVLFDEHRNLISRDQREMELIAEHYKVKYYNGYLAFKNTPHEDIRNFYFKNDAHWNQSGSDLFTKGFSKFLIDDLKTH